MDMTEPLFGIRPWSQVAPGDKAWCLDYHFPEAPGLLTVLAIEDIGGEVLHVTLQRDHSGDYQHEIWPAKSWDIPVLVFELPEDGLCHERPESGDCSLKRGHFGFCDWEGR